MMLRSILLVFGMLLVGSPCLAEEITLEQARLEQQIKEAHEAEIAALRLLDLTQPDDLAAIEAMLLDPQSDGCMRGLATSLFFSSAAEVARKQAAAVKLVDITVSGIRAEAIERLRRLEVPAEQAVPVLARAAEDGTFTGSRCAPTVASFALAELAEYAANSSCAVEALRVLAASKTNGAEDVMGQIEPWNYPFNAQGEAAIGPMVKVLATAPSIEVRRFAAQRLFWLSREFKLPRC